MIKNNYEKIVLKIIFIDKIHKFNDSWQKTRLCNHIISTLTLREGKVLEYILNLIIKLNYISLL